MRGYGSRRFALHLDVARKALAVLLVYILVAGQVPAAAWADETPAPQPAAQAATEQGAAGETGSASGDASGDRGGAVQGSAPDAADDTSASEQGGDGAPSGDLPAEVADDSATASSEEANENPSVPSSDTPERQQELATNEVAPSLLAARETGACTDEDGDGLDHVLIYDAEGGEGAAANATIGSTLKAYAYCEYDELMTTSITYQWQYSTSKYSGYKDIPGATDRELKLEETVGGIDLAGKYIGVVVEDSYNDAENSKTSNLVGPVVAEGTVNLSRVEMWRDNAKVSADSDAILAPGDTVEAKAYTGGSSAESASNGTVVSDGVTYDWELLDSKDAKSGESLGVDSSVTLKNSDALIGKYLKVTADGGAGEVSYVKGPIAAKGAQRLANISIVLADGKSSISPGDVLTAKPVLTGGKEPAEDTVSYQWYIKESGSSEYEKMPNETGKTLAVTDAHLGATFKVEVTAGGYNTVSATTEYAGGAVQAKDSAQAAVAALNDARYMPNPVYGTDTNVARMVEAKLGELGFGNATVRVVSVGTADGGVSVSAADDETNGDVTFYYVDPSEQSSAKGYDEIKVTFEITSGGTTAEWTRYPTVRWDMGKVKAALRELLDSKVTASDLLAYEGGEADDDANTVNARKDLFLSGYLASWADIEWTSDNTDAVENDGTLHRHATETREANLTARVTFAGSMDESETPATVEKTFHVTVMPESSDPTDEDRIHTAFDKFELTYSDGSGSVNAAAVTGDIQLPTKSKLGISNSKYTLTYAMKDGGDGAASITGYRLGVARPEPGMPDKHDTLLVTITCNDASITREYPLTVKALDTTEIDVELALMEQVKASLFDGIKGENASAAAITQNMHSFQQVRSDGNGGLVWAHDRSEVTGAGIVPVSIDETRPSEQWDKFKSSNASIITHENLLLQKQPTYDTAVTIEMCLSSEKFEGYYEKYKDDPNISKDVLNKYKDLARQPVSVTVTVKGAQGENPNPPESMTATVAVVDEGGSSILPKSEFAAEEGQTAWDATAGTLAAAGYSYQGSGILSSVTAPDGTVYGSTSSNWTLYINGEYSQVYAFNHYLEDGDEVVWVYSKDGGTVSLPEGDVAVNPDAEHPDLGCDWGGFGNGGEGAVVENDATPQVGAEESWKHSLLTDEERAQGAYLSASDALLVGGRLYIVSSSTTYGSEPPYASTKSLARLEVIDPATGAVEKSVPLARSMDSICRAVYADGIIVIPLAGGYLQAVSASTLETLWTVDAIDGAQSLSSLTVADGYVYVATADSLNSSYDASTGTVRRVNLYTGALAGTAANQTSGYYWSGGISLNGFYVVADDAGTIHVYAADLSQEVSSLTLSAGARSTLVAHDGCLYLSTRDGVFHKLTLSDEGELSEGASVSFAASSTSTPTIADGKAYVGGASASYTGALAVIDLASMKVEQLVESYDGVALPGDVKATPLVSVQSGGTYVYFTCNAMPGGVYLYRLGDAEASLAFLPGDADQNYSMGSILCGADGTLYYTNDSGNLFALKASDRKPSGPGDEKPSDEKPSGEKPGTGTGETSKTDSKGSGTVAAGAVPAGAVPASATPTDGDEADGAQDEDAVEAGEGASAAAATSALGIDVQRDAQAGLPLLPLLGIAVGVCGLALVALWWQRSRREGR